MKPVFQGQLDSFCGVYSLINAAMLVGKIDPEEAIILFRKIFSTIGKKKKLTSIIRDGLSSRDLTYVFKEAIAPDYQIEQLQPFRSHPEVPLKLYWKGLQAFLENGSLPRAVVLVLETSSWCHWSVVKAITDRSCYLFDSAGLKRIDLRKCTTRKITQKKPIRLYPALSHFFYRL